MKEYCFCFLGAFTAFLRAFLFSCVFIPVSRFRACFGLLRPFIGLFPYTRAGFCSGPVSVYAAGPVSRRGLFSYPGSFSDGAFCRRRAACFHSVFGAVAGPVSGLSPRSWYDPAARFHSRRGRPFPACFGCRRRRFSIGISACFRGRGRGFSIMFPGLFTWPGAAARINIFSAAGAGKVKEMCIEQIFTFRAAHAYAPAYACPRPCTRATPRTPDFPLRREEGKTGQIYSIHTRT